MRFDALNGVPPDSNIGMRIQLYRGRPLSQWLIPREVTAQIFGLKIPAGCRDNSKKRCNFVRALSALIEFALEKELVREACLLV